MYFELLFTVFFINGILCAFYPKNSILMFILLAISIPTSASFTSLTYFNGIFVVDAFFLSLILVILIEFSLTKKIYINKKEFFLFILILLIDLPYVLILLTSHNFDIKFLKEGRPILLAAESIIFFLYIRKINFKLNFDDISKIAFFASLSNLIYLSILFFDIYIPADYYYMRNNYRYLDLSTYFSVYYVAHYFLYREKGSALSSSWQVLAINFSILSIIISNSRFIIFSIFMALLFVNVSNRKIFIRRLLQGVLIMGLLLVFSYMLGATRVTGALQVDEIYFQLYTRYMPALNDIHKMNTFDRIFGYGLGHYFEIPWFFYRENVENTNISVDCAYLTSYVKQGVLGILALLLTTVLLVKSNVMKIRATFFIFWGLMFIVSASFYQIYPLGAVIYNAFLINDEIK